MQEITKGPDHNILRGQQDSPIPCIFYFGGVEVSGALGPPVQHPADSTAAGFLVPFFTTTIFITPFSYILLKRKFEFDSAKAVPVLERGQGDPGLHPPSGVGIRLVPVLPFIREVMYSYKDLAYNGTPLGQIFAELGVPDECCIFCLVGI